jgi:ABC-2 type transport system ATP-binding protein
MASVTASHITRSFPLEGKARLTALKDISFSVEPGELFGIIGPDGAGKTTLFRILTTLLLADEGSATVTGLDVVKDYKAIRQQVGYMPGRFSLYQDLSVEENLEFFATIFNTTIEANYDLIRDIYVQIEPFKKRKAGKLSGGMKQKLALSCALIHRPTVLFLDEPTTGVDAVSRKEFWEMLKRLKQEGITILVSTPYMDEAALCDRVALLQQGRILGIDRPDGFVERYEKKIWAVRSADMYRLLQDLRGFPDTASVYPLPAPHGHAQPGFPSRGAQDIPGRQGTHGRGREARHTRHRRYFHGPHDPHHHDMTEQATYSILAEDLTKRFGDFVAVDHISFQVRKGEIFGFLGANGAGKTTAMRMLCGLSIPSSGKASVGGFDVYTQTEKIKQQIGYMSQKFSLYDDLSVKENIRFYGGIYGMEVPAIREKTQRILKTLNLEKEQDKLVRSLPLGWKQKLSFSVAVFHSPQIVFLDEPTGGVDPVTRREFWEMIYAAADEGTTVFVTTHYMDEAEYCHRVSIMVDGKIAAMGTPGELKHQFDAEGMDGVFLQLARGATRAAD